MADIIKNFMGGGGSETPVPKSGDSDFADFAGSAPPAGGATFGDGTGATVKPFTKWYNIHERHSLDEFKAEGIILVVIVFIFTLHFIGSRMNKAKAKAWIRANAPILAAEFSQVGTVSGIDAVQDPDKVLQKKSLFEFAAYATGRANVAFVDVKLSLIKRFNPVMVIFEHIMGFAFESAGTPGDVMEATIYPFDGREDKVVPGIPGASELRSKDSKSSYDGFVWAIVHKDRMKQLREDRYDLSITFTKDNNKLPNWATVMSESAEITNALLTDELAAAVTKAGDLLDCIVITDQPIDKPTTLAETTPRKRIYLQYRLPSSNKYDELTPLFTHFVRFADHLVSAGKFRPEVLRKIKNVRDENIKQLVKAAEEEKAEERALEREKAKKDKRDAQLAGMDAKQQKKFLEKEKEKELRKQNKKQTMRG